MARLNSFRELKWRGTTRTGYEVRETTGRYGAYGDVGEWAELAELIADVMDEFAPPPSTFHPPPG